MMHYKKYKYTRTALIYPISLFFSFWKKNKYPMVRAGTLTASTPILYSALTTTNPMSGLLGFGAFFLLWGFAVSCGFSKK